MLRRKNESGVMGFRGWTTWHVRLASSSQDPARLYSHLELQSMSDAPPQVEVVNLEDISSCTLVTSKRSKRRFNIALVDGRLLEMQADADGDDGADAQLWVACVLGAQRARRQWQEARLEVAAAVEAAAAHQQHACKLPYQMTLLEEAAGMEHDEECLRYLLNEVTSDSGTAPPPARVRAVLAVLAAPNSGRVHALAVALLFFSVEPALFADYLDVVASPALGTADVQNTLLAILLRGDADVATEASGGGGVQVSMREPVRQPHLWLPVLGCLQHCEIDVRAETLKDICSVMLGNRKNCVSLRSNGGWLRALLALMSKAEVRTAAGAAREVQRHVLLLIVEVLCDSFFNEPRFDTRLYAVLEDVRAFYVAGHDDTEGQEVARTVLLALCSKLGTRRCRFAIDDVGDSVEWQNLVALDLVLRRFVFQTAFWGAAETEVDGRAAAARRLASAAADHEHGLHWRDADQSSAHRPAADTELVKRVVSLLRALRCHDAEATVMMSKSDRAFRSHALEAYRFWRDSAELVAPLRLESVSSKLPAFRLALHDFVRVKGERARRKVLDKVASLCGAALSCGAPSLLDQPSMPAEKAAAAGAPGSACDVAGRPRSGALCRSREAPPPDYNPAHFVPPPSWEEFAASNSELLPPPEAESKKPDALAPEDVVVLAVWLSSIVNAM